MAWHQIHRWTENKAIFKRLGIKRNNMCCTTMEKRLFYVLRQSVGSIKEVIYSFWAATWRIHRPPFPNPQFRKQDNSWGCSNEEKAKLFAEHFQEAFEENKMQSKIIFTLSEENEGLNWPTSPLEIAKNIDRLKLRKSAGHEQPSPRMFC